MKTNLRTFGFTAAATLSLLWVCGTALACTGEDISPSHTPPASHATATKTSPLPEASTRPPSVTQEAIRPANTPGTLPAKAEPIVTPVHWLLSTPLSIERAFAKLDFSGLTNLTQPPAGDDRLFVTEQAGRTLAFAKEENASASEVFLDIRDRVNDSGSEEGLLGLAFDPEFASNGYFYVYYSASGPRRSVLSRFTAVGDPKTGDRDSELVILEVSQPFRNHNGGQIAFGPDGHLYVGLGDGGGSGDPKANGRNPATLLGSVLRIDVSESTPAIPYRIPHDNPMLDRPEARPEIWAYGLRNPWRFSFDSNSGDLWAADVGQNRLEEVDLITAGGDYGWNTLEGSECFSPRPSCDDAGTTRPVWEYSADEGCSIIGGYVYRGREIPSLSGAYVFGDYCAGKIWAILYDGERVTESVLLADTDLRITSFGEDREGGLYVLSQKSGIYRLRR